MGTVSILGRLGISHFKTEQKSTLNNGYPEIGRVSRKKCAFLGVFGLFPLTLHKDVKVELGKLIYTITPALSHENLSQMSLRTLQIFSMGRKGVSGADAEESF